MIIQSFFAFLNIFPENKTNNMVQKILIDCFCFVCAVISILMMHAQKYKSSCSFYYMSEHIGTILFISKSASLGWITVVVRSFL